jgi:hypothetical protein
MRARRLRGRVCGATTSAAALCNGLARRLLRLLTLRRRDTRLCRPLRVLRLLMLRRRGATLGLRLALLDAAATFGGRPLLLGGRSLTLRRGSLLLRLLPLRALRLLRRALGLAGALGLRRLLLLRAALLLRRRLALLPLLLALLLRLCLLPLLLLRPLRLLSLLALLLWLHLLPIGRSLARGCRHLGAALRGARRPVAKAPALVGGERLRWAHSIGGTHDVLRLAKRGLRTEVAAAQILRPHLHGARDRRGAGEHRRPNVIGTQRPSRDRRHLRRRDAWVYRKAAATAGH